MNNVLYAILIAAALLGINIWLLQANKKTPVPKGCENLKPDCRGCGITDCALKRELEDQAKGAKTES
ncbi:MAG: hypothetical protein LKF50_05810 [Solobacterium sp.]|jgi:hypothetical protein|nr:hypothetical protein [Solobacterium sp.]MCH4222025.1 hypothetical protein [Solobacterium sp.]